MHSKRTINVVVAVVLAAICATRATEQEHHNSRRAPSGFTGVRGKKSIPDSAYSDQDVASASSSESVTSDLKASSADGGAAAPLIIKRAPSGFMGMRGKKPYENIWEGTYPLEDVYKRAPSGFMGMRGKKDMEFSNYDDYNKRAPSGFMGMRGKKEYDYQSYPYDGYFDKRAPMGFVGMRGKKDDDLVEDKRAPSGFFGMRGKKQPRQSGFFGMRGKKYPYEFRGKFVGVRGKKASNEINGPDYSNLDLANLGQDLDMNQLMLLLTENNDVRADILRGNQGQ